jgi:hypothetical protein
MNRPSQDDYGYLASLERSSIFEVVRNFWDLWGGNISTVLLAAIFVKLALLTEIWLAYSLFAVFSIFLIGLAAYAGFSLFLNRCSFEDRFFGSVIFSFIGVSSLAFPAHVASLAFITASIAHLWPICIFLILLWRIKLKRQNVFLLFTIGFLVGNVNIAEGAATTLITLILYIANVEFFRSKWEGRHEKSQNLAPLLVGQIFGLFLIVLAPGFASRLAIVSSTEEDKMGLLHSFFSAFVAFTGAVLTTPAFFFLIVLLFFSLLFGKYKFADLRELVVKYRSLILMLVILFGMLVTGSTFAYASWHQSLGLLFLGSLVSVVLVVELAKVRSFPNESVILNLLTIFLSLVFVFDVVTGIARGSSWDRALDENICKVKIGETKSLVSADLLNPLSKLGFEDIGTWDWMRQDYVRWLETKVNESSCI